MLAYYINLILFFISLFTLIYFKYNPRKNYIFLFKTTTSILFTLTALICYIQFSNNYYYFVLLITGMFFSLFGDMFLSLELNNEDGSLNSSFLYGLISFSITHIMYVLAFIYLGSFSMIDIFIALVLALIVITILKSNKNIDFKNMFVHTSVYSFIICLMVIECIKLTVLLEFNAGAYLLLVGALLFIFSNLVLSFILFHNNPKKYLNAINLITYYTSQFLIASTLLFI